MKSYLEQRREMKLNGKKPEQVKRLEKLEKAKFFQDSIKQAPRKCQECGNSLAATIAINAAAIVAHILPKRKNGGCPSVANHPLNKVYLCGDCHTNMDNKGARFVTKMKLFAFMKDCVAKMWAVIAPEEQKNVPEYFKPSEHEPTVNKGRKG